MTTHAYPHLGFDPVRSDEAAGRAAAQRLRTTVNRLVEVLDVLSGTGDQAWEGRTAEAFRDSVHDELRPRVSQALDSFSTASKAFDGWVDALPSYRSRADALETEAADAAKAAQAAASHLDSLQAPGADADDAARTAYQDDRQAASTKLSSARGDLEDVLARARTLQGEVEEHASTVAGAFDTAMDVAPDEPGFFGKLKDVVSDIGHALSEAFDWFMETLAPIIQKLAKVIGALATILAIVAFVVGFVFPPAFALAATLGTVARIASFVDLGIQGLRVLHGEDGALQGFVLSAAGMALGMGAARAIGPIATQATSNIRTGLFVPQLSLAGAGGMGGSSVATMSYAINNDFFHSLAYWGVTSYKDLTDSSNTLDDEL